jgi:hypothetical protein
MHNHMKRILLLDTIFDLFCLAFTDRQFEGSHQFYRSRYYAIDSLSHIDEGKERIDLGLIR